MMRTGRHAMAGRQTGFPGTPEEIAAVESSYTGRYLRHVLKRARKARVGRRVKAEVSAAV